MQITDLTTDRLAKPIGLDNPAPRFGWIIQSSQKNIVQSAYRIVAASDADFQTIVWDTGRVMSEQSQQVVYTGRTFKSMQRIYWQVQVWDNQGNTALSQETFFEAGLLESFDWQADWIVPEGEADPDACKASPYLRRDFQVKPHLKTARAYMSARGLYEASFNGQLCTEDLFAPGFTSYYSRTQYQAYDITMLLQEGQNTWGVILGDGWWRGSTGALSLKNNFGDHLAFIGQINLIYQDGTMEVVCTDTQFLTTTGPIIKSDLKAGEVYDARLTLYGWNEPGYSTVAWQPVTTAAYGVENLVATICPLPRRMERLSPRVLKTPNGETVLDFGQNISGRVQLKADGPAGAEVVLIHGETLDKQGNFTLGNIGMGRWPEDFQEVHYILNDRGLQYYEPHFTVFGFRYVLVRQYPGQVEAKNFTAVAIYNPLAETGYFKCSNPLINQLVSNIRWSQKGNFLEVPTDCPTRERAGWTGDAQLYSRTAADLMDVSTFFEKWLLDLKAEQFENGLVASTVPTVLGYHSLAEHERMTRKLEGCSNINPIMAVTLKTKPGEPIMVDGSAGWADAAVIIPWNMYLCYGDKHILDNQYDSAKAWVDYMDRRAKAANEYYRDTPAYRTWTDGELDADYIWDTNFHFGEWLEADAQHGSAPASDSGRPGNPCNPLVATAYYAHSTHLLAQMAAALGKTDDAARYSAKFDKIRHIYSKNFISPDGSISGNRQAPNVRTLAFDLAEPAVRPAVAKKLADLVKTQNNHLNTGFLSTPFILSVLAENGYADTAYQLLEQTDSPSWLYAVTHGATTVWESWTAITDEGDPRGSLNHYSYGAVATFLFAYVTGLQPVFERPGYKHFKFKPYPGGSLTSAAATLSTSYGQICAEWQIEDQKMTFHLTVPANTTADVALPGRTTDLIMLKIDHPDARYQNDRLLFTVGSGCYQWITGGGMI